MTTTASIDAFASATEMVRSLQRREVRSTELVELLAERIARLNPRINAIVVDTLAAARAEAAARDAADGRAGAFHGLPFTLKESTAAAGLPQTAAIPAYYDFVAAGDGALTARVRGAGGVLIGKTNIPPHLADIQTNNPIYGRTSNPWNLDRTPGGSTGGGAAAVAAGLSPLEFGSDIGGSIRIPAAFCGIYGLRPSETALSRTGGAPYAPRPNPASVLSVQGPLARAAEDLELALDVVAGPEAGEDVAWRLEIPPARHERLAGFRVAILPALDWAPADAEILGAGERVAAALAQAGAKVSVAAPEVDLPAQHKNYLRILMARMLSRHPLPERARMAATLRSFGNPFSDASAEGAEASAADYFGFLDQREQSREAYRRFFREYDILIAPACPFVAFAHDDGPMHARQVPVNGTPGTFEDFLVYSGVATLPGQPSVAFPAGRTRDGLPVGLQAIGPYLEDRTPIRFAGLLAAVVGGYQRPPGYD